MRRVVSVVVLVAVAALAATPAGATRGPRFRPPVRSEGGMVATESLAAARVGRAVLNGGGNAIDAAVATVFAIGVTRPQSCGIGGGGFLVYRSADGTTAALDFRETAPLAFTPTVFSGSGIFEDFSGHRTVGVPGVVDGMWEALQRFGTISWENALRPAERLAFEGVRVTPALHDAMVEEQDRLRLFPAAARIYLRRGRPYPVGATLVQKGYGRSLRALRTKGPRAFYEGRLARLIVADMLRSGDLPGDRGLLRRRDLARYDAVWRAPLRGTYRGHEVTAMPPPTSGGIAVIEMLNILEGFDVSSWGHSSADHFHFLAEAQKIAWADRNEYVADPDFVRVPTRTLISKSYAAQRRREIDPERAQKYEPGDLAHRGAPGAGSAVYGSTTHISVIDRWGNAAAVTCTIEQPFGSAVVAPGTGFLLNNEMTDFDDPGTANQPEGGKRPRSSMSPTIVARGGRPVVVTGGAGGPLIIMGVLHVVVNVVDFGMNIAVAVDAERHDAQLAVTEPGFPLLIEDGRVGARVERELERRGHDITTLEGIFRPEDVYAQLPRVQVAASERGRTLGVTDPRAEWGTLGQ